MPHSDRPAILILARDRAKAVPWVEAVGPLAKVLWTDLAGVPADAAIDLVITDEVGQAASLPAGDYGMIFVGEPGSGAQALSARRACDVRLPSDATAREIALACQLLAEIVFLRRSSHLSAQTHNELERLARTDALTGVSNRRDWDIQFPLGRQAAGASGRALCLALLDLDCFKPINDSAGHVAGDGVLRAVGAALTRQLRTGDLVARLGGDEFGLLLLGSFDEVRAAAIVERVRAGLAPAVLTATGLTVTASAGCAVFSAPLPQIGAMFEVADAALRGAKQAGRNRTVAGGDSTADK